MAAQQEEAGGGGPVNDLEPPHAARTCVPLSYRISAQWKMLPFKLSVRAQDPNLHAPSVSNFGVRSDADSVRAAANRGLPTLVSHEGK